MTKSCTRGEMDITTVFGTVIGGSSPSGCTGSKDFVAEKANLFAFVRDSKAEALCEFTSIARRGREAHFSGNL